MATEHASVTVALPAVDQSAPNLVMVDLSNFWKALFLTISVFCYCTSLYRVPHSTSHTSLLLSCRLSLYFQSCTCFSPLFTCFWPSTFHNYKTVVEVQSFAESLSGNLLCSPLYFPRRRYSYTSTVSLRSSLHSCLFFAKRRVPSPLVFLASLHFPNLFSLSALSPSSLYTFFLLSGFRDVMPLLRTRRLSARTTICLLPLTPTTSNQ